MACADCHMPATTAGGTRYSVHDHMFDFSQPEVACTECHDAGDERLGRKPTHAWNFEPVKFPEPLSIEQNCFRCHQGKGADWVAENLQKIQRRL